MRKKSPATSVFLCMLPQCHFNIHTYLGEGRDERLALFVRKLISVCCIDWSSLDGQVFMKGLALSSLNILVWNFVYNLTINFATSIFGEPNFSLRLLMTLFLLFKEKYKANIGFLWFFYYFNVKSLIACLINKIFFIPIFILTKSLFVNWEWTAVWTNLVAKLYLKEPIFMLHENLGGN